MKQKILILIGVPNSGKTTFANQFINENPSYLSVSRDKLRELLYSYPEDEVYKYYLHKDVKNREEFISNFLVTSCHSLLSSGYNLIIDSTNLRAEYINNLKNKFQDCEISYKIMETSLQECLNRNSNRIRKVPESIIKNMYSQFINLKNTYNFNA